jgi:ABC-type branched-subunit amino acid transport system ATPase component
VSKSFGGVRALVDVHFLLPPSGIVAVIGPNGAGKTTLIHVLTGFVRPDSGHCCFRNRDITRLRPHSITQLGIARTFQDLRLIRQVSALENVLLARPRQRGEGLFSALFRFGVADEEARNRDEALRLLDFVGLTEQTSARAGELSYGQMKLLTLACCLATDAQVLLLDEPVAGVHPRLIPHILHLLRQLRADGKLIVFVEHDIGAVREVADSVVVMDQGRIIAHGSPADVLLRPEIMEAYVG